MLKILFSQLISGIIDAKAQSRSVSVARPDIHPSLRTFQSQFKPQPEPSRHAYRGPTAIRTKINRHNRKRNKA